MAQERIAIKRLSRENSGQISFFFWFPSDSDLGNVIKYLGLGILSGNQGTHVTRNPHGVRGEAKGIKGRGIRPLEISQREKRRRLIDLIYKQL